MVSVPLQGTSTWCIMAYDLKQLEKNSLQFLWTLHQNNPIIALQTCFLNFLSVHICFFVFFEILWQLLFPFASQQWNGMCLWHKQQIKTSDKNFINNSKSLQLQIHKWATLGNIMLHCCFNCRNSHNYAKRNYKAKVPSIETSKEALVNSQERVQSGFRPFPHLLPRYVEDVEVKKGHPLNPQPT